MLMSYLFKRWLPMLAVLMALQGLCGVVGSVDVGCVSARVASVWPAPLLTVKLPVGDPTRREHWMGPVIDRAAYGEVIDFFDVYVGTWHWPAFNIADAAITIGVVIILARSLFVREKQPETSDADAAQAPSSDARAALTARSTSCAPPRGIWSKVSPSAGAMTGIVRPSCAANHLPPMNICFMESPRSGRCNVLDSRHPRARAELETRQ